MKKIFYGMTRDGSWKSQESKEEVGVERLKLHGFGVEAGGR